MRHPLRNVSLLSIAVLVALCTASTASAANVVLNPSFEDFCSSATKACFWQEFSYPTCCSVRRDTTITANSGSASYRMELIDPQFSTFGISSECMPTTVPGGSTPIAFSYRTPHSDVQSVRLQVQVHSDTTCTSYAGGVAPFGFTTDDDAWHRVTGTQTIPAGQSMHLVLEFFCFSLCDAPIVVYYDDIGVGETPTAVTLSSFSALRTRANVLLRWRTAAEVETLGFNLYRIQRGKLVKLNRALIPSVFGRTASGHAYSWLDRRAPREAARYRLQAVSLSGKLSWVGSTVVAG